MTGRSVRYPKRAPKGAPRVAKSTAAEKAWQAKVMQEARGFGWKVWHFHDSRREVTDKTTGASYIIGDKDAAGFPDLHMAHPRLGIIYAELKTDATESKPNDDQLEALRSIAAGVTASVAGEVVPPGAARILVHVWRPRDLATHVLPALRGSRELPRFYGFEVV